MATEAPKEMQDARDLVLASIDQANRLTLMINDGLAVPEEESSSAEADTTASSSAPEDLPPVTPEGATAESISTSTSTLTSEDMTSQESPAASPQPPASSRRKESRNIVPITMPADPVITISNRLNQQLTQLLVSKRQRIHTTLIIMGYVFLSRFAAPFFNFTLSLSRLFYLNGKKLRKNCKVSCKRPRNS